MKKVLTCTLCAAILTLFLAGCGNNSESDLSNSTVTGQVTAVDGNSVTLLLGELAEMPTAEPPAVEGSGEVPTGEAPAGGGSGEAPTGDAPSGGDLGEAPTGGAPSGGSSGEAPSGEAPAGGGTMSGFTAGDKSATMTITDSTVITIESMGASTAGTISDITVGSIVEVVFGDNNTVSSVTVRNLGSGGEGAKT
ncbi:MAG: hypothetical protein EOM51_09780 [Clostridia bacterium]|nr:hypothetical protein [Clostridia bacterium]